MFAVAVKRQMHASMKGAKTVTQADSQVNTGKSTRTAEITWKDEMIVKTIWKNVVKAVINHREKIYNPNIGKTFQNMVTKRNQNALPETSKRLSVNPTT